MFKFTKKISFALLCVLSANSYAINSPVGVRPCCAFGTNLKAEVGHVPVPFFSLGNVLDPSNIGSHVYNDGSQSVVGSLFGMGKENNGLIFTKKGGFIDTAHVRDTGDYTFYLYHELWPYIGSAHTLTFPSELRKRVVKLTPQPDILSTEQKQHIGAKFAGLMAFRLAQWHEIAQWFGLKSVGGWSELASAFSPEDLYSNMLGAKIAINVINSNPQISTHAFSIAFQQEFFNTLQQLGAVNQNDTEQKIKSLDGKWWDSSHRLPDKWVLKLRNYHLSLDLMPQGIAHNTGIEISMNAALEKWGKLYIKPDNLNDEKSFSVLSQKLKSMPAWSSDNFSALAHFALITDSQDNPQKQVQI